MSELSSAIKQVCEEKGLDYKAVVNTIELALAAAYRKDYGQKNQNIKVDFDPESGKSKIFDIKEVVEDFPEEEVSEEIETETEVELDDEDEQKRFNPKTQIQITDAKMLDKNYKIGDEIKTALDEPKDYGRMAAQTAKQVILQKLREAEREMVYSEFKDKEHEVVSGIVQRREGRNVLVDLGKATGIIPNEEQVSGYRYRSGERIKIYVKEVRMSSKGAEIILSTRSEEILKKVFYLEIPEISNGLVELKSVAREAGSRSKVAIWTEAENVDPVGSCVGQRGARIQTIINELGGEKIDIIEWDEDPAKFITNALSPAKIIDIEILNLEERHAKVKVSADQLSLAIGKNGQNVRLAAHLTGWKIDIVEISDDGKEVVKVQKDKEAESMEEQTEDKEEEIKELDQLEKDTTKKTKKASKPASEKEKAEDDSKEDDKK